MPSIVGLVSSLPKEVCYEKLNVMTCFLWHEPFYSHGHHAVVDMHTYVGWTCHERSFSDCMPIVNENRDLVLFFAGEVFSDPATILGLKSKEHEFADGDASYLIHLYEEEGDRFFEQLNGQFAGVIIDRRKGRVLIFNDCFGVHRLFVYQGKDGLFFSSEAKALLAALPATREFDPKGLVELLTCGCTLGERSLYKDIEVLPGGSLLEFENGVLLRKTRFFDRTVWENQPPLSQEEFISRFIETFPRIAQKYVRLRGPVAMSLTGGLDSRMVLGCLDLKRGALPCYTFGSMYRDTFDVKVARQVARECGQPHSVLVLGEEFLADLPSYLEKAVCISDGYLGLSGAAELYANSLAREIAPVRLTGNWGGELLRGVRAFKFAAPRGGILHPDLWDLVEEAKNSLREMTAINRASFVAFQQAPHQGYGRYAIECRQVIPRTPFLDHELLKLVHQAPKTFDGFALAVAVIARYRPRLLSISTDRGFLGSGSILSKGIRRIYREALFKAEYWTSHGAPHWLVRRTRLLNCLQVEDKLLGRHKFYHLRLSLRERLRVAVTEILTHDAQSHASQYFCSKRLGKMLNDHFRQRRNYTNEIDGAVTVALARRCLLSGFSLREKGTQRWA